MDAVNGKAQVVNPGMALKPLPQGSQLQKTPSASDQTLALKKAAQTFEAYFIKSLLKEMGKTTSQGGLFGEGAGKEIYQSLFNEKIAEKMAESGGIGLSKLLIKKLSTGLKISGEATDRREAINAYDPLHLGETVGVRDEDTGK